MQETMRLGYVQRMSMVGQITLKSCLSKEKNNFLQHKALQHSNKNLNKAHHLWELPRAALKFRGYLRFCLVYPYSFSSECSERILKRIKIIDVDSSNCTDG
ncbi:unnamed protein product [Acanthoscelides obtectus]|uniref:Uncharacterized protein n=1 Tax=Acanthoscelides obtectus TaxID=200917 RepID=A0A9P0PDL3_ACAOB|nr:unnamed protein product [Acanthoscelides obtectus]CAK1657296.1 hypothetical protein AOBTE_LOCUS20278 [Acanthoscelides obtectus]